MSAALANMAGCSRIRGTVSRAQHGVSFHKRARFLTTARSTILEVDGNQPTAPRAWMEMIQTLKASGVTMINAHEVKISQEKGARVLDVRTAKQYEKGFIEDSVNVPLYQPIEGWSAFNIARRAGYLAFGVLEGTEPNPDFMQEVEAAVEDKAAGVVLCCQMGGTLEPEENDTGLGLQSRSLIAAYQLVKGGYSGIRVLKNGMNSWVEDGHDVFLYDV